jgi:hypothetical protein
MMGGRVRIAGRVADPVRALGRGAGETVTTAATSAVKVFGNIVNGANKTVGAAAKAVNGTVSAIFKSRRNRRH